MLVFCIKRNHTWSCLAIFFISRVKGDYVQAILRWGNFNTGIQKLFDIRQKIKKNTFFFFFLMRMAFTQLQNAKRAITKDSFRPEF